MYPKEEENEYHEPKASSGGSSFPTWEYKYQWIWVKNVSPNDFGHVKDEHTSQFPYTISAGIKLAGGV